MSYKIALTVAFVAFATGMFSPIATTPAEAKTVCKQASGPHVVCHDVPVGAVIGSGGGSAHCYYLPTVANGKVSGLRKVCS